MTCRYRHGGRARDGGVVQGWCTLTLSLFLPCESLAWRALRWASGEGFNGKPQLLSDADVLVPRSGERGLGAQEGGSRGGYDPDGTRCHQLASSPLRNTLDAARRSSVVGWGACIRVTRAWWDEQELNSSGGNANGGSRKCGGMLHNQGKADLQRVPDQARSRLELSGEAS